MVRMSDLVRGIPTQPAHAPAPPTRLAAGLRESATAPPLRREPKPAPTLDAPALPPPAIEAPAESAEALYGEIQQFVAGVRSEEHTSELQSLAYLVCRLLLEKKKKKI